MVEKACKYVGILWRSYGLSPTVKLHILEKEFPGYLRMYGRTGIFGEDGMERMHNIINRWNRQFANIRQWEQKSAVIERFCKSALLPAVEDQKILAYRSTEKKLSADSLVRKKTKLKSGVAAVKAEKRDTIRSSLLTIDLTGIMANIEPQDEEVVHNA